MKFSSSFWFPCLLGVLVGLSFPASAQAFELAIIPSWAWESGEASPRGGIGEIGLSSGNITWPLVVALLLHWVQLGVTLAGVFATALLMWAGIQGMTGGIVGNEDGMRNTVRNTLTGLVVILFSWMIIEFFLSSFRA